MRIAIVSADAHGRIDPTISHNLLSHLPNRVESGADVTIVPISLQDGFKFNEALIGITGKIVVLDLMEYYGANRSDSVTHLFGINRNGIYDENPEWERFHDWLKGSGGADLYLKRELFNADADETIIPIEWPCYMPAWDVEPRSNFDNRSFEVFYNWGMSNELRPRLHGQMFELWASGVGVEIVSSYSHIDAKLHESGRKWISIHTPHTHRVHINEIVLRQYQSKMSVSMPGAGTKCFRSTEHLLHSVPVKYPDNMAWSFKWEHGVNCAEFTDAESLERICHESWLYDSYIGARELADKYRSQRYVHEYIMPALEKIA